MFKNLIFLLAGFIIGAIVARPIIGTPPQPWISVLEQSGFHYMQQPLDIALEQTASLAETGATSSESAQMLKTQLRRLKVYFLPLTGARQNIYDADCLFISRKQPNLPLTSQGHG